MKIKKVIFKLLSFFLIIISIEVFSFVLLKFRYADHKKYSDVKSWQADQLFKNSWNLSFTAHPFFGYICDKNRVEQKCNNFGFSSRYDFPYVKKEDSELVVGVFGGSVALSVGQKLEESFKNYRAALKRAPGEIRQIRFINFANGGYRQPQQFFALTYFIEMLDIVIMLDGANELGGNLYPQYPLNYPKLTRRFFENSSTDQEKKNKIKKLRDKYNAFSQFYLSNRVLRNSFTMILLHNLFNSYASGKVNQLSDEMTNTIKEPTEFYPNLLSSQEYNKTLIDNWKKYTHLSKMIAQANDVGYFHFLQPSQYVKSSKSFSAEELKSAINQERIKNGYAKRMEMLSDFILSKPVGYESVVDLTRLYSGTKETIYIDDFCHINEKGEKILIETLLQNIFTQ